MTEQESKPMSRADLRLLLMFISFASLNWGLGAPAAEGRSFDALGVFLSFVFVAAGAAVVLLLVLLFRRKQLRLSWAMGLLVFVGLIGVAVINLYWAGEASAAV